ncbi:MAG TPA: helicase HerA-like domain-containing protein, partial [Polyangiales bacterium]
MTPSLYLGAARSLKPGFAPTALHLPAHHMVTHGVVMGMTGSGKTGLVTVLVEEALRARVPVLVVDVKGDLPNLLLSFPSFGAEAFLPWVQHDAQVTSAQARATLAQQLAAQRKDGL